MSAPDLRAALREKAASHRSFYRDMLKAPAVNKRTSKTSETSDEEAPRPRSRDSAVELDETPAPTPTPILLTDALRTLADDLCHKGEHNPYDKREYCEEHCCYHIRSKMILEAQYIDEPFEDKCYDETDVFAPETNMRRQSTLSWDGDDAGKIRRVRTPSVVVSDYSDDVHAGITTVEELEYFRSHMEAGSPSSGRSSCSNLDSRCGSQLSVLDLEDSRCGSHLSVLDLDDSKIGLSPPASDCEDDDSGLERQQTPKKIVNPE